MWQEVVKNRQTWTWAEYVESIRTDGQSGKRFWRQQHSGRIVTRWTNNLTPDQVYVVTLPPPGAPSETLWNRFCEVAGIESANWRDAPRSNESLGAASTLVVRELNLRTLDLSLQDYKRRIKAAAKYLMPEHRREEDAIGFVVPDWLRQEAEDIRVQIERSGAHVVGALDDLTPLDVPGVDPGSVDVSAQLEAALADPRGHPPSDPAGQASLAVVRRRRPNQPSATAPTRPTRAAPAPTRRPGGSKVSSRRPEEFGGSVTVSSPTELRPTGTE